MSNVSIAHTSCMGVLGLNGVVGSELRDRQGFCLARFLPTALLQANVANDLRVTVPSDDMAQGSTYTFVLRADTTLGGSGEAEVHAYKSSRELLISKVQYVPGVHMVRFPTLAERVLSATPPCRPSCTSCGSEMPETQRKHLFPSLTKLPAILDRLFPVVFHWN